MAEHPPFLFPHYPRMHSHLLLLVYLLSPQLHATAGDNCPDGVTPGCTAPPDLESLPVLQKRLLQPQVQEPSLEAPVKTLSFVQVKTVRSKKQLHFLPDEGDELDAGSDALVSWGRSESSGSATEATARISKAPAGNERQAGKAAQRPTLSLVSMPPVAKLRQQFQGLTQPQQQQDRKSVV